MNTKLLAMGNVLMGDDGIAVSLATSMENKLREMGVEVIYGETDVGYSISLIQEGDFIIVLDAAETGRDPGTVSCYNIVELQEDWKTIDSHNISFLDLVKLYFPKNKGILIAVDIATLEFHYGLSQILIDRFEDITQQILSKIRNFVEHINID